MDPYRIALKADSSTFYSIVGGVIPGAVVTQSAAWYIPTPPSGWDTADVGKDRNLKYFGIETQYSAEYKFIAEGAKILRHIWFTLGRKAKCIMVVERWNTTTYAYEPFFSSDLDFSSASDGEEAGVPFFNIAILQDGIVGLLKTREFLDFEQWLHSTSPGVITVEVPSLRMGGVMRFMTSWPIPQQGTITAAVNITNGTTWARLYYLFYDKTVVADRNAAEPVSFANRIFQSINGQSSDNYGVLGQAPFGASTAVHGDNFLFKAERDLYDVQFLGDVDVFINNADGEPTDTFSLNVIKVASGNVATTLYTSSFNVPEGTNGTHTFTLNPTTFPPFNLAATEEIEIYFRKHTTSVATLDQFYDVQWANRQNLVVTFENYSDSFTFKAKRAYNVYQDLVSNVTNGAAQGVSNLLTQPVQYNQNFDMKPTNLVITSTSAICGITKPDPGNANQTAPAFKTSIANFFKVIDSVQSAGLGVMGNTVRLERKGYFLNTAQVITTITNPINVTINPATEWLYNTMKVGPQNQTYDGVNGLKEFNTQQQWAFCKNFPLTDNTKELDLSIPYRTDMYGVFFTWLNNIINRDGGVSSSTNSGGVNDVFMIEVADSPNGAGNYPVKTWPTTLVFNLDDPANSYNLGLSPKRCLLRNGPFLRSILHGLDNDYIKYISQEKNSQLLSNFQSGNIDEDLDQLINQFWLGNKLFLPYIAEVECVSPLNYEALLAAAPQGVIRVDWKGQTIEGFPLETGIMPSYPRAEYRFRLLLSPNNNLANLIY